MTDLPHATLSAALHVWIVAWSVSAVCGGLVGKMAVEGY